MRLRNPSQPVMTTLSSTTRTVHEHRTLTLDLRREAVDALRSPALAKRLTITPDFAPGRYVIKASSFVGRVEVPGLSLRIAPKVSIGHVMLMIRPDRLAAGLGSDHVGYDEDDLADAVAALFQRSVADALARGMRRTYVEHEDRLVAVRGRIDLPRQLRAAMPLPVACRFDEYSLDTPHNRLIKAALRRVVRLDGVTDRTRSALLRTLQWFGEVADRPPHVETLMRRGFGRLDLHYEAPCRLAALILDSTAIGDQVGQSAANAFLVDMNKVFEEFVEDRLRRVLGPSLTVTAQYRTHLDIGGRVPIRPDLVLTDSGRIVLVADVKYKEPDDEVGKEQDLYQVVAYATALGVDQAALIYAADSDRPTVALEIAGRRCVSIAHLNISRPPDKVVASLHDLVQAGVGAWPRSMADALIVS